MDNRITTEAPKGNPSPEEIKEILENAETIAVVGLSDNPERDSFRVASYLKKKGYKIIPVNPLKEEVLGEKCYPDLKSINEKIDIVDIFRKPEAVPEIVNQAIQIKAGCIWMQQGISHSEAAEKASKAGIPVIQSQCIRIEHSRYF